MLVKKSNRVPHHVEFLFFFQARFLNHTSNPSSFRDIYDARSGGHVSFRFITDVAEELSQSVAVAFAVDYLPTKAIRPSMSYFNPYLREATIGKCIFIHFPRLLVRT